VSGGDTSVPHISPGAQSAGLVRYNSNMNFLEVYDGICWKALATSSPTISLTHSANEALSWAIAKMQLENEYGRLAESHPAVKIAMENLEKAKMQLDATIILSKEHVKSTS
jgi:hypothetical protein